MLFYAEYMKCTGGYDGVNFHELAFIVSPLDRFTRSGDYLYANADQLPADGTFRADANWNTVSYGSGVSGDPDEKLSGRIDGDRATGTFEDVPLAVELRDGDPVSELSQAGVAATSGAAVGGVVVRVSAARLAATSRSIATASLARCV